MSVAQLGSRTAAVAGRGLKRFYWKAYDDNLTGMSGMVAYNLLLSTFPLALLALFIASQVLGSSELQESVFQDLQQLFPSAAESTLTNLLSRIETSTTGLGIAALVSSIWICTSFWGALDTAFCRIYHMDCRPWLVQKRFGLAMLAVSLVFIAATVAVPTLQSILLSGADDLPFGLGQVHGLVYAVSLGFGLLVLFGILAVIYRTVPNGPVPWRGVWPGAAAATVAIAIVDNAFPAYLSSVSSLSGLGTSLIFIVIVLFWFYGLAIIILGGAEVNAIQLEPSQAAATADQTATTAPAPRGEAARAAQP